MLTQYILIIFALGSHNNEDIDLPKDKYQETPINSLCKHSAHAGLSLNCTVYTGAHCIKNCQIGFHIFANVQNEYLHSGKIFNSTV